MNWAYTEEQEEVRNLARKILEDLTTHERLVAVEASDEGIDRELYTALGSANLLGVAIEEAYGGSDMGFFGLGVLLVEIGRSVAPVPVLPSLVLGALPISRFGTDAQKQRFLPDVASGKTLLTAALIEAGSEDPTQPQTTATRDGDHWRLDGVKSCVPAAHVSDRILIPARISPNQIGVFLLDPRTEGVEQIAQQTTNREAQSQVTLNGSVVSDEDMLGDADTGAEIVEWMTDRATAAVCLVQLGVSERALEMTAEYTRTREQFNRPVGSFQAVHMRAGDAYIDVEAMRLTALEAAWRLGEELPDEGSVAVAKYWCADGGQRVGYATQHLHGGIGIDIDYPLYRYYLWAKQAELTLGSAVIQLTKIGETLARAGS
jgi:alkylation response protein AidB-like acyl-CoA dehydrogenase